MIFHRGSSVLQDMRDMPGNEAIGCPVTVDFTKKSFYSPCAP